MPQKRKRQEEADFGSLWMHAVTGTPPRRKACLQCFEAKVRCDHRRPVCSRCTRRALRCDFSGAASEEPPVNVTPAPAFTAHTAPVASAVVSGTTPHIADPSTVFPCPTALFTATQRTPQDASSTTPFETRSGEDAVLLCTVDAQRVRDRWLEGWVPRPGQQPKELGRGTAVFIHSILRAYPQALCAGDLPPIIHGLQLVDGKVPSALADCASIARMWKGQEDGASEMVQDTTVREMGRLFAEKEKLGPWQLLAAFQAYVMYVTLLVEPEEDPVVPQDIMLNLQDFAHTVTATGLVVASERPPWPLWALAEAKRRSLFAMYMLDDIVNAFSHVSCILGDELASLPAPCSERLWRAEEEGKWRRLHDVHVADWEGGGLRLEELWPRTGEKDEVRVQRWVKEMDGLGMTVFAVTTATQYH